MFQVVQICARCTCRMIQAQSAAEIHAIAQFWIATPTASAVRMESATSVNIRLQLTYLLGTKVPEPFETASACLGTLIIRRFCLSNNAYKTSMGNDSAIKVYFSSRHISGAPDNNSCLKFAWKECGNSCKRVRLSFGSFIVITAIFTILFSH